MFNDAADNFIERQDQIRLLVVEGDRLFFSAGMTIDELDDTDHLLLKIGQRKRQHRARAVAGRLVKGLVETKRDVSRNGVEIIDQHRLGGRRHIAGDRRRHDGNAEIRFAQLDAVILNTVGDQPVLLAGFCVR